MFVNIRKERHALEGGWAEQKGAQKILIISTSVYALLIENNVNTVFL